MAVDSRCNVSHNTSSRTAKAGHRYSQSGRGARHGVCTAVSRLRNVRRNRNPHTHTQKLTECGLARNTATDIAQGWGRVYASLAVLASFHHRGDKSSCVTCQHERSLFGKSSKGTFDEEIHDAEGVQNPNKLTTVFHRLSFHHSFGKRWGGRLAPKLLRSVARWVDCRSTGRGFAWCRWGAFDTQCCAPTHRQRSEAQMPTVAVDRWDECLVGIGPGDLRVGSRARADRLLLFNV